MYFVQQMGFIHLFIFILNFSKSYIFVLESFSFQETAIFFPGEVWIFLELDNADGYEI